MLAKLWNKYAAAILGLLWAASLAVAYHFGVARQPAPNPSQPAIATDAAVEADATSAAPSKTTTDGTAGGFKLTEAEEEEMDAQVEALARSDKDFDPAGEFARIRQMPLGPERNRAMELLFRRWGGHDPHGALAAANTITEPLLRYELKESVMHYWAKADPEAAWAYGMANRYTELPESIMSTIMAGIARGDINKALNFFTAHGADGSLRNFMDTATMAFDKLYQRGGHDLLVNWVEQLPQGRLRDEATNRIIDQWARYDPESAKVWMDRHIAMNKENTVPARIELAESWARVDPQGALRWINSLPETERQSEYYRRVFKRWLDYDQNAAAAYLSQQPPSPVLDQPIERYAHDVMARNPAATMPWAEAITDEKRRFRTMERIADHWRKKDPQGLIDYVLSRGFTEEQAKRLIKPDEIQVKR